MADAEVQPETKDAPAAEKKVYNQKLLDPDYKGEPLSQEAKDGPIANRHCTDILCCLVFTAFFAAMIGCGIYGFANGDPLLLTYPYDSSGNQCGAPDDSAEDYNNLYFPAPHTDYTDLSVCVKDCPEEWNEKIDCYPNKKIKGCTWSSFGDTAVFTDTINQSYDIIEAIEAATTTRATYPTIRFLDRFCIPDDSVDVLKTALDEINDEIEIDTIQGWLSDVAITWDASLMVAGFTLVLAAVYLLFLRWCLGFIIWMSIIFILAVLCTLGWACLWSRDNLYKEDNDEKTRETLLWISVILFVCAGVFLLYILCMCQRIRLAIAIMKSGTIFIKDTWQALLVPPVMFIIAVGLFCYWVFANIYIFSVGEIDQKDEGSAIAKVDWDETTRRAFYFHFFGFFWIVAFMVALGQFTLSSSVAIWYFATEESGAERPVSRSIWRAFRYHLGTLAFGSFLLAVVWSIKFCLYYLKAKLNLEAGENSKVIACLLKIAICFINCFERFIKFLTKNSYIQTAIMSSNFCTAAKDAFFLVLRNCARFLTLGSIGDVFMFFGKVLIVLGSVFFGYMLITRWDRYDDKLTSPFLPCIVFGIISYLIAALFMIVYGMATDTILHCFIADEELNSADGRGAYHAPEPLREFMGIEKDKKDVPCCK